MHLLGQAFCDGKAKPGRVTGIFDGEKAVDELVCLYAAEVWRMIGERDRAVRRQRDGQVAGGIFGGVAQDVVKHAPQRARELPA